MLNLWCGAARNCIHSLDLFLLHKYIVNHSSLQQNSDNSKKNKNQERLFYVLDEEMK